MRALILLGLLSASSLSAADLTIQLYPKEVVGEYHLVSVTQLFDPGETVENVERTGPHILVYRSLPPGTYAVTRHSHLANWASSPIFDQTIEMEDRDQTVVIRHPKVRQWLSITLPDRIAAQLEAMFDGAPKIPCRVQRVEGKTLPPYGYRWLMLDIKPGHSYTGITELSQGTYALTFPFGLDIQPWPPLRRPSNQLPQPFLSFQIQIDEKLQVSSLIDSIKVTVRDALPSDVGK